MAAKIDKEKLYKKNLSILFVEDNDIVRSSVLVGLEMVFEKTLVAVNGEEALDILKEHTVDFILTDINMPRVTGVDLIAEIRKVCKSMPIIITTAYNEFNEVYQEIPHMYVINKPYSIFDIIVAVDVMEEQVRLENAKEVAYDKLDEATNEAKKLLKLLQRN